ncbi:MAG: Phosphatidate cytidylyltransferase [Bacteroidetes bacterium ADurb.Bin174]|nr:MAG: Phosphatidate cytidylyltransferase [Bacteroidetes bacterium ADurb.Bin174]
MNNFLQRTLSGLSFVVIVVGSILISPYTFAFVFVIITAWTVYEFHKLTNSQGQIDVNPILAIAGSVILFLISFFFASSDLLQHLVYSVYGFYVMMVLVFELYRKKKNPLHNWAYFLLGQVFIALPFSLLNYILYIDKTFHPWLLIAMFATIWLYDTGAYLVGVAIGKHKMFERISPKKTWEGFAGGVLVALIVGYVCSIFITDISLVSWLFFALIVVIFSTFGDLMESLMKRTIHVKDSGNVIPGHGGLLDRFDSMLMVAPAIVIYLSFLFFR